MKQEIKNKGGRPKVNPADKKSIAITIRLTPVEYARIRARVNAANFSSVTEFITYSALNNLIVQHFLRSDVEFVKNIAKMGNNLNQIARQANTFGFPAVAEAATVLIAQIQEVVQEIGRRL